MARRKSIIPLRFLVTLVILVYFARLGWELWGVTRSTDQQLSQVQQNITDEQRKNAELKQKESAIGTDAYLEKAAREKLGMVKPNERVFEDPASR